MLKKIVHVKEVLYNRNEINKNHMNPIRAVEVTPTTVTFKTGAGSIMLTNGTKKKPRIVVEMGFTTPVEYKQAVKKFYAIMRDQKENA